MASASGKDAASGKAGPPAAVTQHQFGETLFGFAVFVWFSRHERRF